LNNLKLLIRVLVVDDYEPWRRFVSTTLRSRPELQLIGEASDGLEAVHRAEELQPDLVVLDLGLPTLNGIEVARRIARLSPKSKILFLTENRSWDIAEAALRTGALGYVVKSDAARELLPAVNAVLRGERFVSTTTLAGSDVCRFPDKHILPPLFRNEVTHRHEAGFYSDDRYFLDDFTQHIGTALKSGNAAVVVVTESHRHALIPRLQAYGLDMGAAIEEGRCIVLDAAQTVMEFMVDNSFDPARCLKLAGNLITRAANATGESRRVIVCGECDPPLWRIDMGEAAIQLEKLWNEITFNYDVDILCGYSLGSAHGRMNEQIYKRIQAEHSAVYSR
jgi:CheY-like chemotaxis protein